MITTFKNYKLITEDPDNVDIGTTRDLRYWDDDAIPFACKASEDQSELITLKIGNCAGDHSGSKLSSDRGWAYPGRVWTDNKIISFWVYPNDKLLRQIIVELEKKLHTKMFKNDWRIEIVKRNNEVVKKEVSDDKDYYYAQTKVGDKCELIPLEDYAGSEDFSDLQKQMHLMGWAEKQRLKEKGVNLAPGFGADRTAWDQPRNLKYRQSIYQEKKN